MHNLPALFLICLLAVSAAPAMAQTPSKQEIIDALSAPSQPVRTRSLRNLKVGKVGEVSAPAEAVLADQAAEAPSISLLIQFDFDSARIRPESVTALGNLAAALVSPQLAKAHFLIEGHTDGKGREDYNLKLSANRANAVRDWLVKRGVTTDRLAAVGLGSTQLADPDPHAAANRRVRIVNVQ